MKRLNISVLILVVFACGSINGSEENSGIPKDGQVSKLAAAAWKEPIESIDVTFYKDYATAPEPIEQLRKEAEEIADRELKGRSIDELKPYEIERRNKTIEMNLKNWVESQKHPRKAKCRVRISGENQRIDMVIAVPNEKLGQDTPFVDTYVNTKDDKTGEFVSYHYAGEMNTVFVDTTKWAKQNIDQFAGLPFATALTLQFFLGIDQGSTPISLNYIPDPNKMTELARTGLASIEPTRGAKAKGNKTVKRIGIRHDPNAPGTRDIVEIGDSNHFPSIVLICDRNDYSRVYRTEFHTPTTNQIMYIRECDNFNSNGFPHNITEIKYDMEGNLKEKSVYNIVSVDLNPSFPDDLFRFNPPEGYKVVDNRTKKP
jgi:hypothetical protein